MSASIAAAISRESKGCHGGVLDLLQRVVPDVVLGHCLTTPVRRGPIVRGRRSTMRTYSVEHPLRAGILAAVVCGLALSCTGTAARAADVVVPGSTDFPESMTATAD